MDAIPYDLMTKARNDEVEKTVLKEQNRLFNFIRRSVSDIEDAKDILQDVLYQFISGYDDIRETERTEIPRPADTDLSGQPQPGPFAGRGTKNRLGSSIVSTCGDLVLSMGRRKT